MTHACVYTVECTVESESSSLWCLFLAAMPPKSVFLEVKLQRLIIGHSFSILDSTTQSHFEQSAVEPVVHSILYNTLKEQISVRYRLLPGLMIPPALSESSVDPGHRALLRAAPPCPGRQDPRGASCRQDRRDDHLPPSCRQDPREAGDSLHASCRQDPHGGDDRLHASCRQVRDEDRMHPSGHGAFPDAGSHLGVQKEVPVLGQVLG